MIDQDTPRRMPTTPSHRKRRPQRIPNSRNMPLRLSRPPPGRLRSSRPLSNGPMISEVRQSKGSLQETYPLARVAHSRRIAGQITFPS